MVQRELYMNKIEEFIDVDLIKIITVSKDQVNLTS